MFTTKAITHVKEKIVPRFEYNLLISFYKYRSLAAGFTRVKYLGLRANDKARMAYIELIGNPIEIFEKNETQNERERLGL